MPEKTHEVANGKIDTFERARMNLRDGAPRSLGLFGERSARGARPQSLLGALLEPARQSLGRRNRLSNFAFFVLAATGGSSASVVAVLLAAWSLISLALKRFRWRLAPSDAPVVVSCCLFFAVIAGSTLFHAFAGGDPAAAWRSVGERLLFLLPVPLVVRMRCSRFPDTLPPAFLGSAVGGLLLVPVCFLSLELQGERISGLAGNSGPFSMMALLAVGWSILSLPRGNPSLFRLALALAGAGGGALAVALSGMRGAWPALPVVILIGLVARRGEIAVLWRGMGLAPRVVLLLVLVGLLGAGVHLAAPLVAFRFAEAFSDLSDIADNIDTATSLNLRRAMYEAASQAIAQRPWFGYGQEAHWSAVSPYLDSRAFDGFSYTHLHNVFLTIGVEAGLVGLAALAAMVAAPVWTAWHARHTADGTGRLAAAFILVAAFLVPGLSNIMFFHDILDSVWVFAVSLIAASVPAAREDIA